MSNLSFFGVPMYWTLCMIPHGYAINIMKKANNGRWNNTSPRSSNWDASLRKSTPADIYSRYERAEAAHKNGFENLPLFVGAVLAGNIAKLDTKTLNTFVASYLASRVLYTLIYINVSKNSLSYFRTVVWLTGAVMCLGIFVKSGMAMA
ncbi:uncharacterized protein LY89DRAFT_789773 [Mollisia scopiformis]|uniref:Uncharacterized protein n=1 Tax=Mollisia scopiformis TaxID=149040 RepID=A0A132B4I8_MOLSC|nr:uncharacterized protein LY89DRAFT_789773 [Mollisia scopiformis]KUJ07310.1 hypothetical protein LY89DRAFT_789773 [Mollisia scopiformis]